MRRISRAAGRFVVVLFVLSLIAAGPAAADPWCWQCDEAVDKATDAAGTAVDQCVNNPALDTPVMPACHTAQALTGDTKDEALAINAGIAGTAAGNPGAGAAGAAYVDDNVEGTQDETISDTAVDAAKTVVPHWD